jgi:glycosyltransferase involved in cell wall biosynthesis
MKVFAILIEPASYTIDRNKSVYDPLDIKYCYLRRDSLASDVRNDALCLEGFSVFKKVNFIRNILQQYDIVIVNGYVHFEFVVLFLLNFIFSKRIGIDSDTQYSLPKNIFKRWFKFVYLNVVFSNKNIYGLAGGTLNHVNLFVKFGMPTSRVYTMPMVVDNEKFFSCNTNVRSKEPFSFIYVGRIVEHKNIRLLIDAFILVSSKYVDSELLIVGDGKLRFSLMNEFSHHKNIVFLGPKFGNELLDIYRMGNALVLPSAYEPWGLVVNEALSAGIPVIVSDKVGSSYDLVLKPNTGLVVKFISSKILAEKMVFLIENEEIHSELSINAFEFMNKTWDFNFYRDCLISFIFLEKTLESQN